MNDKFNEQKDTLSAIKKELNLLYRQVDYLIRNEKPLELLDLDVMMNRTHTLYDLMCGVDLGACQMDDDEEVPVDPDTICELLVGQGETHKEYYQHPEENPEENPENVPEDVSKNNPEDVFENNPEDVPEEVPENNPEDIPENNLEEVPEAVPENNSEIVPENNPEEEPAENPEEKLEEMPIIPPADPLEETPEKEMEEEQVEEQEEDSEENLEEHSEEALEETQEEKDDDIFGPLVEELFDEPMEENEDAYFEEEKDDEEPYATHDETDTDRDAFGFILKFEPIEEPPTETTEEAGVFTTGDEVEMIITPKESQEEAPVSEPEEADTQVGFADEGNDDGGFELEPQETLGDKLQQEQNLTLGDRLQQSAVKSLHGAIGMNDKFLFVNELFNGSMEKYNRSIENLDDLKTLNGALIYLNELRVELQWNSSNEAYKKLLELVHRKFEA